MNTKDIKVIDQDFYYYQIDKFANIKFGFRFNYEGNKRNCLIAEILCSYLNKCSAKYKTLKEINNKCRDLYSADYVVSLRNIGKKYSIEFGFRMIDHKIIGENYFKEAINFFKEVMFNPLFIDNELDSKIISTIRQDIYDSEKEMNLEPSEMQYRAFLTYIIPNSDIVTTKIANLSELVEVLSTITDKDIVDFYHNLFNNYSRGYCFGNLSDDEIKYIHDSFRFTHNKFNSNYFCPLKVESGYKEVTDKETTQSYLYMTYSIKDFKEEDIIVFDAISAILNSSTTGLVMKVLRAELGIVYSAYADFLSQRGFIFISAKIDKKNKDKCIEGINEIMKRLHDKDIVKELLKYHQEKCNENHLYNTDNIGYFTYNLINHTYETDMDEEEEIDLINKLTVDDVLKASGRLVYKNTFFYRGDK